MMFFFDPYEHVPEHPQGRVAVVVAPVSGGLVRIRGHLGRVHAAQRKAALALGPDLVGKVQVDVRYVQDLCRLGAFLK
jgi:hypothetical protein